jgi:dTDP-4-amino-4,6-dideoxygalactose transaminase
MISVFGSLVGEEEIKNVTKCMKSQWMGFGKDVDLFESEYSKKFGLENFAMVDSGSNALYMAVKLLNLPPNSEIILPSFTWVSCAQAIILAGHVPIFCDVDSRTMNIRASDIRSKITNKTKAVMIVHYAGLPVDIDPIIEIGFPVIEDAAHAVYSIHKNRTCGGIGDVGIFSFDAVKNLTVGEGGGITSLNPEYINRAKIMRYCGIGKSGFDSAISDNTNNRWWEYNIQEPFIKMLPNNLAANIGLAQLKKIDSLQERRKEIWEYYQSEFSANASIKIPMESETDDRHSYFTYCIRVPKRDELAQYLLDNDIYSTLRYHPLHLSPLYNQTHITLQNSEDLNKDALSIPLHPGLSDAEVNKVADMVKKFYA